MNWSLVAGFLVGVSWTIVVLMIATFLRLRIPEETAVDEAAHPVVAGLLSGHSGGSRPD